MLKPAPVPHPPSGKLFERCRAYLLRIANESLAPELQGKLGGSDLVQQTFLEAQRDFAQFRDETEEELRAWLRQVLRTNLANTVRDYRDTAKRDVNREVSLNRATSRERNRNTGTAEPSPSSAVATRESHDRLRAALEQLPEHYRQIIQWRNYDCLSFEEISQRLDRSAEAARKLWGRALQQLQQELESPHESA